MRRWIGVRAWPQLPLTCITDVRRGGDARPASLVLHAVTVAPRTCCMGFQSSPWDDHVEAGMRRCCSQPAAPSGTSPLP